jgi:hypothetical protein
MNVENAIAPKVMANWMFSLPIRIDEGVACDDHYRYKGDKGYEPLRQHSPVSDRADVGFLVDLF